VRDKENDHEVLIELMIMNPMTKTLSAKQYRDHVDCMGLANSFDTLFSFS
jgi:hypothetical protein